MLAAAFCFAVNGALIKILLASGLHPLQITFVRLLVGVVAILPFVWRAGWASLKTRHPGIHALRALAGGGAMYCGIAALDRLGLADFTALSFSQPLFAVMLAVLVLGEPSAGGAGAPPSPAFSAWSSWCGRAPGRSKSERCWPSPWLSASPSR